MTAEQVYQKFNEQHHLEGNNGGIQKHKHYILQMMNEFAKLMCDKQKKICLTRTGLVPYKGLTGTYLDVDRECIINSPYPDELQGNN